MKHSQGPSLSLAEPIWLLGPIPWRSTQILFSLLRLGLPRGLFPVFKFWKYSHFVPQTIKYLLHWHYSPMRAFAPIMDLLHQTFLSPHFWFPNRQFFTGWGYQPHAQPPTWKTRFHIYNPWDRVVQLYPQALGTHFSRLLWHAWATVGLFFNSDHHTGSPYP
jgi:hypothetical protein